MVHWSCSSALCFNNYKTVDGSGEKVRYYRLPRDKRTQAAYQNFFKTSGFNWKYGFICAVHWSSGERKSSGDLPDVVLTKDQYELLKLKYKRAKKVYNAAKNPTQKQTLALNNAKKKLRVAMGIFKRYANKNNCTKRNYQTINSENKNG